MLILLDIQEEFPAANLLVHEAYNLLDQYGDDFLEIIYADCGASLIKHNGLILIKHTDSAADVIAKSLDPQPLEIIGVNTCCCVDQTLNDIRDMGFDARVLVSACNDCCEQCRGKVQYDSDYYQTGKYENGR